MGIEIDMKDAAKQIEFKVEMKLVGVELKNLNQWKVRVWIGRKLIELAAWVIWAQVKFIEDEK